MRRSRVVEGDAVLSEVDRLAPLWDSAGAPHTARAPWLTAVVGAFPGVRPVLLTVEDDGEPVAAACLSRRDGAVAQWAALGHEVNDYAPLGVVDESAAGALAEAITRRLSIERGPWRLRIEQLPVGDRVGSLLAERLEPAEVVDGTSAARLELTAPRTLERHVSRNARRSLNRARNLLLRDGHALRLTVSREATTIGNLLDSLVDLHRARDRQLGRRSDLDDPAMRTFYRDVVGQLASRGEIEVTTAEIGGELAAFTLAILDGENYRCWGGRVAPAWTDYSIGRLCDMAAVESALADERFTRLDWMRGVLPYKTQAMTHEADFVHLHAWSSESVRRGYASLRLTRRAVRAGTPERVRRWVRVNVP